MINILSPNGKRIDCVEVENHEALNCRCTLYVLVDGPVNKAFCLKCGSRFKATHKKKNGKRVFVFDQKASPQILNQLNLLIEQENTKQPVG